jgi:hypothetical protein
VIDTCGYVPRVVAQSADALADSVGHYTFVSSISVYADFGARHPDESSPVGTLEDPTVETVNGETYGPLKALCEQAVQDRMGERAFIVRPGLLVGPLDHTGRFTYWVTRVAAGGDVLAPGDPSMQVQFIDTRDGAEWMVRCAEAKVSGVQNMTGPREPLTMREFLDACRTALNPSSRLVWLDEQFLLERGVKPWTEVPLWIPSSEQGLLAVSIDKALASGLTFPSARRNVARHAGMASLGRGVPSVAGADQRRSAAADRIAARARVGAPVGMERKPGGRRRPHDHRCRDQSTSRAEPAPNVLGTASTNVRSSRRMNRRDWANAKFFLASESAFSRTRYASYAARLSNAINPHPMSLVPSCGRKYPSRSPPQRGMIFAQLSAYSAHAVAAGEWVSRALGRRL